MRARRSVPVGFVAAAALLAGPALAADYPVLRGTHAPSLPPPPVIESAPAVDWNGLYVGAFGIATQAQTRGRNTLLPLVNTTLAGNPITAPYAPVTPAGQLAVGNRSTRSTGFGAFVGYNIASEDALLGLEADFSWLNSRANLVSIVPPATPPLFGEARFAEAQSQTRIDQLATVRARAGLIFGSFMPYVTGGFAWANANIRDAATLDLIGAPPGSTRVSVNAQRNAILSGYTIGAGLEARFGGLLLRGEYLYTALEGSRTGRVDLNQARVGAGVAF